MNNGHIILSWHTIPHPESKKTLGWYMVAGAVIVTFVVYGILTQAITMSIAFLVFAGVYFLVHRKEEQETEYQITSLGVSAGKLFFPYADIGGFYIVYDPPIKMLYLELPQKTIGEFSLPIGENIEISELRDILKHRGIKESQGKQEPLLSILARMLKL